MRRSRQIQKPPFPKKVRLRRPDLTALGCLDQSATCKANTARDSHEMLGMGNAPATYAQRQGLAGAAPTVQTEAAYQGLRPSKALAQTRPRAFHGLMESEGDSVGRRIVISDAGWDWGPASDDPTSFQ